MNAALYLPARAKLNLYLRVVGRRADGYHLLDTLFHTLALHDDVALERRAGDNMVGITVTAEQPELLVPPDADNLAVRAVRAVQNAVGDQGGFHVRLHKRIPHGGGLGGGSSDAAAALRLANTLLGRPLDRRALAGLAVGLGADVPFFLRGGTQWGRGIGDELSASADIVRHFVLLVPPFGCDTVAVYKNHAAMWHEHVAAATVDSITVPKNRDAVAGMQYRNDLEGAAERLRPELGHLRRAVVEAGFAQVRMTGSGSTLFVALDQASTAARCRQLLQQALAIDDRSRGHRATRFVVTESGPAIDTDQPTEVVPVTVRSPAAEAGEPRGTEPRGPEPGG